MPGPKPKSCEDALAAPYNYAAADLLKVLDSSEASGLTSAGVTANKKHGENDIPPEEGTPFWMLVLKQFDDNLVKILLGAAFISTLFAIFVPEDSSKPVPNFNPLDFVEPGVIMTILILNAIVGVVQEENAEATIEALKEYEAENANVIRNGTRATIATKEIVCGDVVVLSMGDKVPADCRVITVTSSQEPSSDQAMLTGESDDVVKNVDCVGKEPSRVVAQDKTNVFFSGTTVTVGSCTAVVVGVGPNTEMGKIHSGLADQEEQKTPLKIKLDEFGDQLSLVISGICVVVFLMNIPNFEERGSMLQGAVYYIKIAVALGVAAILGPRPACCYVQVFLDLLLRPGVVTSRRFSTQANAGAHHMCAYDTDIAGPRASRIVLKEGHLCSLKSK